MTISKKLKQAVAEFVALRDRVQHPDGEFDNAGRWYPDVELECCKGIRRPSRGYPYSLMVHCRTAAHVAARYGVSAADVRKMAKKA